MTSYELNARIAMKLFPGKTIHRNGEEIKCCGRVVDFRKSHLMERLLYGIGGEVKVHFMGKGWVEVNEHRATTLAQAVAMAYVNHEVPVHP